MRLASVVAAATIALSGCLAEPEPAELERAGVAPDHAIEPLDVAAGPASRQLLWYKTCADGCGDGFYISSQSPYPDCEPYGSTTLTICVPCNGSCPAEPVSPAVAKAAEAALAGHCTFWYCSTGDGMDYPSQHGCRVACPDGICIPEDICW
jgi:hypothetical protein